MDQDWAAGPVSADCGPGIARTVAELRARPAVTTDPALFAVVLAVECRAHFRLSSQDAAQQACGQALQLAKRSADNTALVAAHRMNGILIVAGGHPAESVPDFLAALDAAERLGDGRSIAMALGNLGAAA